MQHNINKLDKLVSSISVYIILSDPWVRSMWPRVHNLNNVDRGLLKYVVLYGIICVNNTNDVETDGNKK